MGVTYKEVEFRLDYVLKRYYNFTKLYSLNSKRFAEYVLRNYNINLNPGINLEFFLTYKLMEIENLALREFVKENLRKEYI